jgi:hypothetical protein
MATINPDPTIHLPVRLTPAQARAVVNRMGAFRWFYNRGLAAWTGSRARDLNAFKAWILPTMRVWRKSAPWAASTVDDIVQDAADYLIRDISGPGGARPRFRRKKRNRTCGLRSRAVLVRRRHARVDWLGTVEFEEDNECAGDQLYGFALTRKPDRSWEFIARRR